MSLTPLSILLYSGDFDRIHYALCMATAAAAIDKKVTLCITMQAFQALLCDSEGALVGWQSMTLSSAVSSLARTAEELDSYYRQRQIASFEQLVEAAAELGITCIACEMGMRALGLEMSDLDARLQWRAGGLASFFQQAGEGAIITI
jgi:peroxiredoxin family protein